MKRYFQGGAIAAYQNIAMVKLHYKIAHALDECLASLEIDEAPTAPPRRRRTSQLLKQKSAKIMASPGGGLHFTKLEEAQKDASDTSSGSTDSGGYLSDDEHEKGGFDGVDFDTFGTRLSFLGEEDGKWLD